MQLLFFLINNIFLKLMAVNMVYVKKLVIK